MAVNPVIFPVVDQKFVNVALVVEELPKMELLGTFNVPLTVKPLTVVVLVTERVPPTTISPVEVRDARDRVFKLVAPETESELRVAPDLTVNVPLMTALFERFK